MKCEWLFFLGDFVLMDRQHFGHYSGGKGFQDIVVLCYILPSQL